MKKLRILLTSGCLGRDGISSAWKPYIKAIYENTELANRVQLDWIAFKENCDQKVVQWFEKYGCHIHYLPHRQKYPLKYIRSLCNLLRREHYDIIHANGQSSILVMEMMSGWLAGTKIRIAHSHSTACMHNMEHKLLWWPFQWLCSHRIACGMDAGRWLFGHRKFIVINNAKDLDLFRFSLARRKEMRERMGIEGNFVVGNVGRLNADKNQSFLIHAFVKLKNMCPNAFLLLVGEGPGMEDCRKEIERMGIADSVRFTGYVNNVADYLQAMDVVGFPSKYEGLPSVIIEWQAAGLPCVISDKVTRECAVTDLCSYEPIDEEPTLWANRLLDMHRPVESRADDSREAILRLTEVGYNVKENARKLVDYYKEIFAVAMHKG